MRHSVAMERQQWVTFVLLTYTCPCQQYKMNLGLDIKYPVFLSDFNQIWMFWADFSKSLQYRTSRNSVWWEPSWYGRTDGQTDRYDEDNGISLRLRTRLRSTPTTRSLYMKYGIGVTTIWNLYSRDALRIHDGTLTVPTKRSLFFPQSLDPNSTAVS